MTHFSPTDCRHMARALRLAEKGLLTARPNPRVGCVLVRDGEVVGEGWHRAAGEAHAEVNALAAAGSKASGATAYVTLEPCASTGRTGPCADALIRAGIARVVVAREDPSQHANGGGRVLLERAGIEVLSGLMEAAAGRLNEGFLKRVNAGQPFVRLKIAASSDGATAMQGGESRWITGDASRRDVQTLRAMSGAILTGIGTVLADDPLLTVRDPALAVPGQPLRVVLDSRLRMSPEARMLNQPGETLIFCRDDTRRAGLEKAGAAVRMTGGASTGVDVTAVLRELASLQVNDLLVEAGPALSGALLVAGVVDELVIYQAPHMMGSRTLRMLATPDWCTLGDRMELDILDTRRVGRDLKIVARPVPA